METDIAILEKAWTEFVSDPDNLEEFHLGLDKGFDVRELVPTPDFSSIANIRYIGYARRDYYLWLDRTLLCPMCNRRTNYKNTDAPYFWRHKTPANGNGGKICFYGGHPTHKGINNAELTASQVAYMLGVSNSLVLELIKHGILKSEVNGNRYIVMANDICDINEMRLILKKARKENWPRVNYINCHVANKTHLPPELQNDYIDWQKSVDAITDINTNKDINKNKEGALRRLIKEQQRDMKYNRRSYS